MSQFVYTFVSENNLRFLNFILTFLTWLILMSLRSFPSMLLILVP